MFSGLPRKADIRNAADNAKKKQPGDAGPLPHRWLRRERCYDVQRPCSWKSYEFAGGSQGPASTGLAKIERAATAARISLVMTFLLWVWDSALVALV